MDLLAVSQVFLIVFLNDGRLGRRSHGEFARKVGQVIPWRVYTECQEGDPMAGLRGMSERRFYGGYDLDG